MAARYRLEDRLEAYVDPFPFAVDDIRMFVCWAVDHNPTN